MHPAARLRNRATQFWHRRRLEIRHGMRITAAGLASYATAEWLNLPQGYWAVFTAVLVVQGSVGGSWKAAIDRLAGTLLGAVYGAVVAVLIPHTDPIALGVALTISLIPLSLLAAFNPAYRVAPITAIILLLGSTGVSEGPIRAAMLRTLEVALGSIWGMVVSVFLLPARAHILLGQAADKVLKKLSELFPLLLANLGEPVAPDLISAKQDAARAALASLETIVAEAARERRSRLSDDMDPEPIARTLRRLRNDLILIGRMTSEPLPPKISPELNIFLQRLSAAGSDYLRALGDDFARRRRPVSGAGFDETVQQLLSELKETGSDERLVALRFALQQLQSHLDDLRQRAEEFAAVKASRR